MKTFAALTGAVAFAAIAGAAQVTTIVSPTEAIVEDTVNGISMKIVRTDNSTDFDSNGFDDSTWQVLLTNGAVGGDGTTSADWTNSRFRTETAGFDLWDSGDQFGGFVGAWATQDGFLGNEAKDPSGDAAGLSLGNQIWPSFGTNAPGRGPVDIGLLLLEVQADRDDISLSDALAAQLIIPDNEAGDLFIGQYFGNYSLQETISFQYDVATGTTIVPEPTTLSLLVLGGLALVARRR